MGRPHRGSTHGGKIKQINYKATGFIAIFAAGLVAVQAPYAAALPAHYATGKCVKVQENGTDIWKCAYSDTSTTTKSFTGGLVTVHNDTKVSVGISVTHPQPLPQPVVTRVTPIFEQKEIPYTVTTNTVEREVGVVDREETFIHTDGADTSQITFTYEDDSTESVSGYSCSVHYNAASYLLPYYYRIYNPNGSFLQAVGWMGTSDGALSACTSRASELNANIPPPVKTTSVVVSKTVTYEDGYIVTIPPEQTPATRTHKVDTGQVKVTYSDGTTAVVPAPGPAIGSQKH